MRLHEMVSGGNDLLSLSQLQNADTLLQVQTTESVQDMLTAVQNMFTRINDPTLYHLHNIRHSPRSALNSVNFMVYTFHTQFLEC